MSRFRIPKNLQSSPRDYSLFSGASAPHHLSRLGRPYPLIECFDGSTLDQHHNLPFQGRRPASALTGDQREDRNLENPLNRSGDSGTAVFDNEGPLPALDEVPTAHRRKQARQALRWDQEVIPTLILHYMTLMRQTQNLRSPPEPQEWICSCGGKSRVLDIVIVRFSGEYPLSLALSFKF